MKYDALISRVNQIINSYDVPLTLRQIYYRLVAAGDIQNTRSCYNALSSQTTKARENGQIDDRRMTDRSRRIDDVSFDSPEDFLDACLHTLKSKYVRRYWDSQSVYCEVWVEKDALSGVLAQAVYEYNTIVAPAKGYSSYTYLRDAADRIKRYCKSGKVANILYFGDHDPSGLDMTRDLQDRLTRYCGNVTVLRVGLTFNQVKRYNLIPNNVKKADRRAKNYISQYGLDCWELDAVDPAELIRLCATAIDCLIDNNKEWQAIKDSELSERNKLISRFEQIQKGKTKKGIIQTIKNQLSLGLY
jgi:hypothetical protein